MRLRIRLLCPSLWLSVSPQLVFAVRPSARRRTEAERRNKNQRHDRRVRRQFVQSENKLRLRGRAERSSCLDQHHASVKTADTEKKTEPSAEKAPAPAPAKPTKPEMAIATVSANAIAPVHANSDGSPDAAHSVQPHPDHFRLRIKPMSPLRRKPLNCGDASTGTGPKDAKLPIHIRKCLSCSTDFSSAAKTRRARTNSRKVDGNTYTNETYGFQMYKPPDWQVIAGASTLMPGAITAMGTGDQTTYLLIGQGPPEKRLRAMRMRRTDGCATSWKISGRSSAARNGFWHRPQSSASFAEAWTSMIGPAWSC